MLNRYRHLVLFVLLSLLASAVPLLAQAVDGAVPSSGDYIDAVTLLTSSSGVMVAAIFLTYTAKKLVGDVEPFNRVPVAIYLILIAGALTVFANKVLLTLPGSLPALLWQALYNAFAAAGAREIAYNGAKPMSSSGTGARLLVIGAIAASAIGLTACGPQRVQLPAAPAQVIVDTDQALRAATIKALSLMQATGALTERVVDVELELQPVLPAGWHARFKAAVVPLAQNALKAIDVIESGTLKTWAALKAAVDPVIAAAGAVVDLVRALPQVTSSRSGFAGIVDLLGQIVGAVILDMPRQPSLVPTGA